jgi:hypothetical protein
VALRRKGAQQSAKVATTAIASLLTSASGLHESRACVECASSVIVSAGL